MLKKTKNWLGGKSMHLNKWSLQTLLREVFSKQEERMMASVLLQALIDTAAKTDKAKKTMLKQLTIAFLILSCKEPSKSALNDLVKNKGDAKRKLDEVIKSEVKKIQTSLPDFLIASVDKETLTGWLVEGSYDYVNRQIENDKRNRHHLKEKRVTPNHSFEAEDPDSFGQLIGILKKSVNKTLKNIKPGETLQQAVKYH